MPVIPNICNFSRAIRIFGLTVAVILTLGVWFLVPVLVPRWVNWRYPMVGEGDTTRRLDEAGQFGDQFGAIGAMFSAAAFLAVLLGLYFQWRESQDHERRENARDVMQARATFEHHFYELLRGLDEIRASVRWITPRDSGPVELSGRAALEAAGGHLREAFESKTKARHPYWLSKNLDFNVEFVPRREGVLDEKAATEVYKWLHESGFGTKLGHYFRHTYVILDEIHLSPFSDDDKDRYARILRATISARESAMLFYNCLAFPKARERLCEFEMFSTTSTKYLGDPAHALWLPAESFAEDDFDC